MGPKMVSWNVRGLVAEVKHSEVRRLVRQFKVYVILIQEAKLCSMEDSSIRSVWGGDDCAGIWVEAIGNSGGLLTIWNTYTFEGEEIFRNRHCLVIKGCWKVSKFESMVANVYAPCEASGNKQLWEDIIHIKETTREGSIVGGDFNSIRNEEERRGCSGERPDSRDFNEFINRSELIDFPMQGKRFWMSS